MRLVIWIFRSVCADQGAVPAYDAILLKDRKG